MDQRICSVDGCEKRRDARGLCPMHYRRWQKDGDPGPAGKVNRKASGPKPKCSIEGCDRPVLVDKRGWCSLHFQRWQRHGDPRAPVESRRRPGDPIPPCSIDGCDTDAKTKGLCHRHYENLREYGDPLSAADRTPMQRLEHVGWDITESGCWEWRGNRNRYGYGRLSVGYVPWIAPRLMLSLTEPQDDISHLVVRHACDNPPCVNPEHLSWGSMRENTADMVERGRDASHTADWWGGVCKNGLHDITLPDALTKKSSSRSPRGYELRCTECMKASRQREKEARNRRKT